MSNALIRLTVETLYGLNTERRDLHDVYLSCPIVTVMTDKSCIAYHCNITVHSSRLFSRHERVVNQLMGALHLQGRQNHIEKNE